MSMLTMVMEKYAAEKKLSNKKLAHQLGMSPTLFAKKMSGASHLTPDQLHDVAHLLGYSMEAVYDLERS